MNFSKFIAFSLVATMTGGCQILTSPNNHDEQNRIYTKSVQFETHSHRLTQDLADLVAPLTKRTEKGKLSLTLRGGTLDESTRRALKQQLAERLLLPVELDYQADKGQTITGKMAVTLLPDTCRFNPYSASVSFQGCEQLRNRYVSTVTPSTWRQGKEYQEGNSALSAGAIQRLYKNKIKSAEKQSVSGE